MIQTLSVHSKGLAMTSLNVMYVETPSITIVILGVSDEYAILLK